MGVHGVVRDVARQILNGGAGVVFRPHARSEDGFPRKRILVVVVTAVDSLRPYRAQFDEGVGLV
jgi:hypothetical protein